MLQLLVTILPSLIIVLIFVKSDKFQEPNQSIIKIFVYGIIITIPAYIGNTIMFEVFRGFGFENLNLLNSFLTAAPIEEGLKFLILYWFVYKMKDFNEPIDGMVYGVCASLGFATLENFYYVYHLDIGIEPLYLAILRGLSTIPAHGVFGALMGYFFMKYSFVRKEKNLFLSFFVPFLLHGIYNFFVGVFFGVSLVVIIVAWFFAIRFFLIMKKKQKTKKKEYEKKI